MAKTAKRRIALGILVTAVLVPGSIIAWQVMRPRNDPRIVSGPAELKLIPRSQYQSRPWFTLPWFGGRKLQYPAEGKMPKDWKDNPMASGVMYWVESARPAPTAGLSSLPSMRTYFPMVATFYMSWEGRDGSKPVLPLSWFGDTGPLEYAETPYVFGTKPVAYKVVRPKHPTLALIPIPDFEIELPPTGFPAPKLEPVLIKDGDLEIKFQPEKWFGPSFSTTYSVTAKGLEPGEHLILGGGLDPVSVTSPNEYEPLILRVSSGETSYAEIGRDRLLVTAYIVREEPGVVKVVAGGSASAGLTQVEYKDSKGRVLATGYDFAGSGVASGSPGAIQPTTARSDKSLPVGFKIDGKWVGYSFENRGGSIIDMSLGMTQKPHPKGTYNALFYTPVRQFTINQAGFRLSEARMLEMMKKVSR